MKLYLVFAVATATISLLGCSGIRGRLNEAEGIMGNNPKDALRSLYETDNDLLTTGALRARYALLLSEALDKNYMDLEDDSLVMIAVKHYEKSLDRASLAKSYYYAGRVHFNAGDYQGAIVYGTLAERESPDQYLSGLALRLIADTYHANWNDAKAAENYSLAARYFERAGKKRHQGFAMSSKARMLMSESRFEDCRATLDSLSTIIDPEDIYLLSDYYYSRIALAGALLDYDSLTEYFEKWKAAGCIEDPVRVCIAAARTFAGHEMPDSAYAYLALAQSIAATEDERYQVVSAYSDALYRDGHFKESIDSLHKALTYQGHVVNSQLSDSVEGAVSSYWKQVSQIRNLQNNILKISIMAIVLLVGLILYIIVSQYIRKKKEAEDYKSRLASAIEELQNLTMKYDDSERKFVKYIRKRQSSSGSIMSVYSYLEENRKHPVPMEELLSDIRIGKQGFKQLIEELNDCYNGVMDNLLAYFPDMKPNDTSYGMLAYWFYGFSHDLISLLIGVHRKSLYDIKYQWSKRFKEMGKDGEQFIKLLPAVRSKS